MIGKYLARCSLLLCLSSGASYAGVTVQQALREGCYADSQVKALVEAGMSSSNIGSRTLQAAKNQLDSLMGGSVTRMKVTAADTWVYRGYGESDTDNWHTKKLLAGVIYSKGQNQRDKKVAGGMRETEFWSTDGPDLNSNSVTPNDPVYFMMRLLSIKSSDTPPSQFVSYALNYEVASGFGTVVYAFQVNPNSPVLGVVGCKRGGEDQFQIPGGTLVKSPIFRRTLTGNWQMYSSVSKTWGPVPPGMTAPP